MIGLLINKFDNDTLGTVKEFNELFPFAKLRGDSEVFEVEILEPIIGKETTRLIRIGDKEFEHSFLKQDHRAARFRIPKRTKKFTPRPSKYIYTCTKDGVTHTYDKMADMAKFLNRSVTALYERFNAGYSKNVDGWIITKERRK